MSAGVERLKMSARHVPSRMTHGPTIFGLGLGFFPASSSDWAGPSSTLALEKRRALLAPIAAGVPGKPNGPVADV
jgi:hypothetical protein